MTYIIFTWLLDPFNFVDMLLYEDFSLGFNELKN